MNSLSRLSHLRRTLALLGAVCALGTTLVVAVSARQGDFPDLLTGQAHEEQRARFLRAEWEAQEARFAKRAWVLERVLEGRMTLLEAAAHFHELRTALEARYPAAPRPYPHLPPAERACRDVLDYVGRELAKEPVAARAILWRLETELEDHRQRGTLRLSPPQRRGRLPRPDEVRAIPSP